MSEVSPPEIVLNWVPTFDERSKMYAISAVLPAIKRRNKLWRVGTILDQGKEGACVGFGWTAEALSTPVSVDLTRVAAAVPTDPTEFAISVYNRAKLLDPWVGVDYSGTSVLAGAKAMREYGLLKEFRWAFSVDDIIDAVISTGPVVIGINWHYGMYWPKGGILNVTGRVVGGHCLTVVGYRTAESSKTGKETLILQNSWGTDWGINGLAEINVEDLAVLLEDEGEACVPFRRSYGRTKK